MSANTIFEGFTLMITLPVEATAPDYHHSGDDISTYEFWEVHTQPVYKRHTTGLGEGTHHTGMQI